MCSRLGAPAHLGGERGDARLARHRAAEALARADRAELARGLLAGLALARGDQHARAGAEQRLGADAAKARRPAGDERRASGDGKEIGQGEHGFLPNARIDGRLGECRRRFANAPGPLSDPPRRPRRVGPSFRRPARQPATPFDRRGRPRAPGLAPPGGRSNLARSATSHGRSAGIPAVVAMGEAIGKANGRLRPPTPNYPSPAPGASMARTAPHARQAFADSERARERLGGARANSRAQTLRQAPSSRAAVSSPRPIT